jgi:hypothetical protein
MLFFALEHPPLPNTYKEPKQKTPSPPPPPPTLKLQCNLITAFQDASLGLEARSMQQVL